jgi:antitoxin component of MazEF toxin-antitoxin module
MDAMTRLHWLALHRVALRRLAQEREAEMSWIQRWGDGQGVMVSRELLAAAGLSVDDEVDISVRDGLLVVAPVGRTRASGIRLTVCEE